MCHFDVPPPIGPLRKLGAAHDAEIPYVFGLVPRWMRYLAQLPPKSFRDVQVDDEIQTYWTNFAKMGNPNGPTVPVWPEFSKSGKVLQIGRDTAPTDMPDAKEHALFDGLIEQLHADVASAARP